MIGRQRKETAVDLAASIIALTLGEDVEMTIIVRDVHSGEDDRDIMIQSSVDTATNLAKLLYRAADHLAMQTAGKE